MSTQRYVSTSFWDDEWIQTLDPSEKLLYLYLMTNPLTNIAGVYKITVRRICFDTGFNSDTIGHLFAKFQRAGKAFRIGEYVAMPSWPKHQRWEKSAKIKEGILSCLKELPEEVLCELAEIHYRFDLKAVFDTLSIPYPYPRNYSDSDGDSDLDLDTDIPGPSEPCASAKPNAGLSPDSERIARLLVSLHQKHWDKDYSPEEKHIQAWRKDIDLLHRKDGRSWEDIERVVHFAKTMPVRNNFTWATNIMSGSKLREKFDTLIAQAKANPPPSRGVNPVQPSYPAAPELSEEQRQKNRQEAAKYTEGLL